jgi:hypothetical protein
MCRSHGLLQRGSRAVSASTHARAHWSQVGKGQTFETVFVESDKQILNLPKVPVGEKVYLQRDKNHGLSAITQGGSSRQNMMREMLDARWSDVQVNGRPLQTRDLIRIPDHTNFYTKPAGELVVVVEETVPRIGITDISKRPTDQQKYTCELCVDVSPSPRRSSAGPPRSRARACAAIDRNAMSAFSSLSRSASSLSP